MPIDLKRIIRITLTALLALSLVPSQSVHAFPLNNHAVEFMSEVRDAVHEMPGDSSGSGEDEESDSEDDTTAVSTVPGIVNEDEPPGDEGEDDDGIGRQNPGGNAADIEETEPAREQEELMMEVPEQEDAVKDEAELAVWFEEHRVSGGRVTLTDVVTLTQTIPLYGCGNIVIDTGSFGLVYDGGFIHLYGSEEFSITGEGVEVPVLDIFNSGSGYIGWYWYVGGWNMQTQPMHITATGRGGVGGVALRIRRDDNLTVNTAEVALEGQISSYGEGAVGLYLDVPLDAYCYNIKVEGSNSAAVYAAQGANLYYCKLEAEGDGATSLSGGGDILLDTCTAWPLPQNVQTVNHHIFGIVTRRFYEPVECKPAEQESSFFFDNSYAFLLRDDTGSSTVVSSFYIEWDQNNIDTGVLGSHTIHGSLTPPFRGLGIENEFPLELIIEVCDPDLPMIDELIFMSNPNDPNGKYLTVSYWCSYEQGDGDMILWRSNDLGETWYDSTDSPDVFWPEWRWGYVDFYCGEIADPITLQLERVGVGVSNIITLRSTDGIVMVNDSGGDRTGVDRVVVDHGGETGSNGSDGEPSGNDTKDPAAGNDAAGDPQPGSGDSGQSAAQNDHDKKSSGSGSNAGVADKPDGGIITAKGDNLDGEPAQAECEPPADDSQSVPAAVLTELPLIEMPVKENLSAAVGSDTEVQSALGDSLNQEAAPAIPPPEPEATAVLRISRPDSKSRVEMRTMIVLAAAAAALFTAAFIRNRRRSIMGGRVL